jgi:hypothetical protein
VEEIPMAGRGAWLLVVLGVLAAPGAGVADEGGADPHAVQPERPTVATHAHTVAVGWVEIEAGLERDRAADGSRAVSIGAVTKVGLARRAQLNLMVP